MTVQLKPRQVFMADGPWPRRMGLLARFSCAHKWTTVLLDLLPPGVRIRVCVKCGTERMDHGNAPPARTPGEPGAQS